MAGGILQGLDFDVFYSGDDFGVVAIANGEREPGQVSREEIDTDKIQGFMPTFRCRYRFSEGSQITIESRDGSQVSHIVEAVLPLEFEEFLHVLSLDDAQ